MGGPPFQLMGGGGRGPSSPASTSLFGAFMLFFVRHSSHAQSVVKVGPADGATEDLTNCAGEELAGSRPETSRKGLAPSEKQASDECREEHA